MPSSSNRYAACMAMWVPMAAVMMGTSMMYGSTSTVSSATAKVHKKKKKSHEKKKSRHAPENVTQPCPPTIRSDRAPASGLVTLPALIV